ncbi:2-phosphosulfolactate phosphatase [Paenibacillus sp. y28]|uniref:2-phosphosulfolactate phosphatase n=1 Tax=Paenibacillus sp. y28 TaxID=3129110 RepID=UPI003016623C
MNVHVVSGVDGIRSDTLQHRTAVVIDVLRGTSVMVTALEHGCRAIVPVETVHQAKLLQEPGDLLGGERFCRKIAGFDFGNSPLEYHSPELAGRKLILTTTNGTRALHKCKPAAHILAASLLNVTACAAYIMELKRDVVLICAGTNDEFAFEDGLCAGMLLEELRRLGLDLENMDDLGTMLHRAYLQCAPQLEAMLLACSNGRKLSRLGFEKDVLFCAQTSRWSTVPAVKDGLLLRALPGSKSCPPSYNESKPY